jgi:capsule polysaccharide export protein KpsE/RkpR
MDSFDPYEYAGYLRRNWRFLAAVCAIALGVAAGGSLLATRKYTATARLMIEPPAGDQHISVAISPIYLESLKTYEHFASSDQLFLRALERFGLRAGGARPIESWKRSVLKVEVPRNTKVLEISATLPDAKKAHALALYLAEETARLNRDVSARTDADLIRQAEQQAAAARDRLDRATEEWNRLAQAEPVEGLSDQLQSAEFLRGELERDAAEAEVAAAGTTDPAPRLRLLNERIARLDRDMAAMRKLLSGRNAHRDVATDARKDAEAAYNQAENHLREMRATAGYRGEQLTMIDPGITPERPSFPNVPLNLAAALMLGFVAGIVFLTLRFSVRDHRRRPERAALRVAGGDA